MGYPEKIVQPLGREFFDEYGNHVLVTVSQHGVMLAVKDPHMRTAMACNLCPIGFDKLHQVVCDLFRERAYAPDMLDAEQAMPVGYCAACQRAERATGVRKGAHDEIFIEAAKRCVRVEPERARALAADLMVMIGDEDAATLLATASQLTEREAGVLRGCQAATEKDGVFYRCHKPYAHEGEHDNGRVTWWNQREHLPDTTVCWCGYEGRMPLPPAFVMGYEFEHGGARWRVVSEPLITNHGTRDNAHFRHGIVAVQLESGERCTLTTTELAEQQRGVSHQGVRHAEGCGTRARGCVPGCDNYDPHFDNPLAADDPPDPKTP